MRSISVVLAAAFMMGVTIIGTGPAHAQVTDDCSTRDPAFPNHNSSEVLRTVETKVGTFPIRRGFYCVPNDAVGDPVAEYQRGFGFGYDKARHRHAITKIKIMEWPLKHSTPQKNTDGHYNFYALARKGRCDSNGKNCEITERMPVVAVVSPKNFDTYYTMPAGNPVGFLTFYCDSGDPSKLRCPDWVNTALDIFK
ncbi:MULTISPECIES: hypothetical protein [unclassified Nocardia]|uniref:hypothetical protein n=1 Tax=unclassified Nocardia TaxID=2637762 RepID=UPI00278C725F|nr:MULTISPECIES: hypothetical protein [unclassified Nocardia]